MITMKTNLSVDDVGRDVSQANTTDDVWIQIVITPQWWRRDIVTSHVAMQTDVKIVHLSVSEEIG
jgi:hypothetical protein